MANLPHDAMPHVIRLRGPWQYRPLARTVRLADGTSQPEAGALPEPGSMQLPADWSAELGADFHGRVLFRRRFGRPTGLAATDRVELVVAEVDAYGRVTLNDRQLGPISGHQVPWRADVTDLLETRNDLAIEVELPRLAADSAPLPRGPREGLAGGLVGEVRLEIHEATHDARV